MENTYSSPNSAENLLDDVDYSLVQANAGKRLANFFIDLLVAYANTSGGTNIADIQLFQNNILTTAGADIENTADLVTLAGVGLGKIIGTVLGSNDVVHFNGA